MLKDCRANINKKNTHSFQFQFPIISSDSTSHHFIQHITGFNHTAQGYWTTLLPHINTPSSCFTSAVPSLVVVSPTPTPSFITADTARCWGEVMWTSVKNCPQFLEALSLMLLCLLLHIKCLSDHFKFFNKVEDALSHHCYFHDWRSCIKLVLFTREAKTKNVKWKPLKRKHI